MPHLHFFRAAALAAVLALATVSPSMAQTPERIGEFRDWSAISYVSGQSKVCYVVSVPSTKQPANVDHGDNFFVITQRRGQNVTFEPQLIAGYPLRQNAPVTVTVDGRAFTFFSQDNSAWTENAAEDPALVAAMKAGSRMQVQATSRRGTNTTYEYSLSGVTAALDAIANCR